MTMSDTLTSPASAQSPDGEASQNVVAETRTGCGVLHQFDGSDVCQSSCTLDFGHDGSHSCGNGHDF